MKPRIHSIMVSIVFKTFLPTRPSPPVLLFHSGVKVFTLSGSHQQYQSHLCDSFSWNCCTSLKSFSLGLRSRGEKNYTHRHLKQYFTSEVIRVSAKIFTASCSTYCLAGRLRLRCCEGEGGGGGGGRGILLWSSLLFWLGLSSRCVVMGEIGAASRHWGHCLATARHRSHMARERKRGRQS